LNLRVTSATYYQDGTAPQKSSSLASYNTAGLLQTITAQLPFNAETQIVKNIQYTAKGQRSQIDYGNGTSTKYTYDQLTQRTVSLITTRPDSSKVQSLQYTYDAVGRITNITDAAQQTVYFDNTVVDPSSSYVYDAAGRLVQATGREHLGQIGATAPGPWDPGAATNGQDARNGSAMARYAESYFYDEVNNIQSVKHGGSNATTPGWTRTYNYAEPSLLQPSMVNNRLSSTMVGGTTSQYKYDGAAGVSGCMTSMPHLSVMTWGYNDMLQATASQVVNTGTPEMTYYQYNATNSRTRKVTNRQAAAGATPIRKSERIYLGPLEIYREFAANGTDISLERQTMSFSDNSSRILLAETRTIGTSTVDPAPQQLLRYQLTNHLDSCCIELDATSALLSYEEYTPFGSSSYRATATALETPNRYRFAGRERDDETGFYDYGARAYAPWLGRWISADPLGAGADGVNVFAFVRNNPIMLSDQNGMQSTGGGPTVQFTPSPVDVTVWHLFMEGNFRTGGMQRVPIPSTVDPGAYDFYGPKLTVTFDFLPGSRGKYGSELHENIDRVLLPEAKDLNLPGADRMYGELAIGQHTQENIRKTYKRFE
jgi:RHS repeat-associated protein